ncbi:MAG: OmpH family outer membrane protein [Rhabdochlamydiaceae bacterium]|nr:OmpH family outer membrane protein [Rhabdochlamydiaceae bacterium]
MFKQSCKKWIFLTCLAAGSLSAAESVGVVNFADCVTNSKVGQEEQARFDGMKKQLGTHLEQTEKEMNDLASKLNDPEYLDGLSPEAEKDLKEKIARLNEEFSRYQNQYYQVLNQANMKVVQLISSKVNAASELIAKDKKLTLVLHKDVCFFYSSPLDITVDVIAHMDKAYEQEKKEADKAR